MLLRKGGLMTNTKGRDLTPGEIASIFFLSFIGVPTGFVALAAILWGTVIAAPHFVRTIDHLAGHASDRVIASY